MLSVKAVRFRQGYMFEQVKTVPYLGVAQLKERVTWVHEAGSSSLPAQTNPKGE